MVQQYLDHVREILTSPRSYFKTGSKGSGLISLFGYSNAYDLREGFPLLTTKRVGLPWIVKELLWFLSGETNIRPLEIQGVDIWRRDTFELNLEKMIKDGIFQKTVGKKYTEAWEGALEEYGKRIKEDEAFAKKYGDAGPVYGKQWRRWEYVDEHGQPQVLDQVQTLIDKLIKKPTTKKAILTAWNAGEVERMALEPCHVQWQATAVDEGKLLGLNMFQRSCDQFLGVPFNIASYVMITMLLAREIGQEPRYFVHMFGDSHLYTGLEKRTAWYRENFEELRKRVRAVTKREEYLEVLEWVNNHTPRDPNEEKYDHVTAALEQLSREPRPLPKLEIANKPLDQLVASDFKLTGYNPHPKIERKMAV
ncbi:MAG: thymidylate synthase [Nanoarchaeota archaeon]|nr:thymidylate synthase [Nanoarchaeota archaeon]